MLHSKDSAFSSKTFAMPLLEWHFRCGRVLPWMTKHPYDVWLSEVMLQQTQVSTVLERYASFKKCFPTIENLAAASVEDVLAQWSGLGYYSRARNLHACAKKLVAWKVLHNEWPQEANDWVALPGIGQSTANAIVSACFNKVVPILDANAKRVLLRFAGDLEANNKSSWTHAIQAMDVDAMHAAAYTQAIMDLGAIVCRARKADCSHCPLSINCKSVGWEMVKKSPKNQIIEGLAMAVKPVKPVVAFHWALCIQESLEGPQVLLQQRDQSSFWPDLWVLPELGSRFLIVKGTTPIAIKHELSHRSLRINAETSVLVGNIERHERWVLISDIAARKMPVPSPIATLVKIPS